MEDLVVIYHGDCPDGLAAAWVFTQISYKSIQFHAAKERNLQLDRKMPDLTDKRVFILDFCYSRDDLLHMRTQAKEVHVLDHHETAAEDLKDGVEGVHLLFDLSRCGAEIAWDYCHGDRPRPWWFIHIRDRDLWEWKHPDSHAFSAWLFDRGLFFDAFDELNAMNESMRYVTLQDGRRLYQFQQNEVHKLCRRAKLAHFEGFTVCALNTWEYRSECGSELSEHRNCDFAFLYAHDITQNAWVISLRGKRGCCVNLSLIAKRFGGGGHPNACSFVYHEPLGKILRPIL